MGAATVSMVPSYLMNLVIEHGKGDEGIRAELMICLIEAIEQNTEAQKEQAEALKQIANRMGA